MELADGQAVIDAAEHFNRFFQSVCAVLESECPQYNADANSPIVVSKEGVM